jgi:pyrimidine-nucleoside phosphorylase
MRMVDIITRKKSGIALSREEVNFVVTGYTRGEIPDYQIAAWLMAVCWQGMTDQEITDLTLAMAHSGDTLDLHNIAPTIVDKHSTGGVGDKTSLVLTPMIAAAGLTVAKMSGRGLGFSGGTIDKLESIPGFQGELALDTFREVAQQVGLAITGQSVDLAPADKKLYALRDVTGTVESVPLIASSIMSKKLAAGSDCIVLDVKTGRGAFITTIEDAQELAQTMVTIGERAGRKVRAVISDMDQPLGCTVGNTLELHEAIQTLQGKGPDDLLELCLTLGGLLLQMAGQADSPEQAQQILKHHLDTGKAWQKFRQFIIHQGGDPQFIDHPDRLPHANLVEHILSPQAGYLADLNARQIAQAGLVLGAGRATKEERIDHAVGVVLHAKVGCQLQENEPILTIHANDPGRLEAAREILEESLAVREEPVTAPPLILGVI